MSTPLQERTDALEARSLRAMASAARRDRAWQLAMPLLVLIPAVIAWELYARGLGMSLVPPASKVVGVLPGIIANPNVMAGLISSDESLLIGYAAAAALGVPLGLLMGRVRVVDGLAGPVLDLAMVTPVVVVMPVILMAFGISRESQELIIFAFALPFVTVPCRAGARAVAKELIEMATSFGASELQLWREALLPGSIPAIATGLRLGFGQAITGMVTVELTMVAIGIGNVILDYQSSFRSAEMFAVVAIIIVQSVGVMAVLRILERQVARRSNTRIPTTPEVR